MWTHTRSIVNGLWMLAVGLVLAQGAQAQQQPAAPPAAGPAMQQEVTLDGQIGVHALMSLSDAHLQKLADVFSMLAAMESVQSADWEQVRQPLSEAARVNVPALHWFALPDGSYYTLEMGKVEGSLADRPYFPRLLAGETVLGELVVSKATGKSTAIVAVPVYRDQQVVGVLGASVYLDRLSEQINKEMNLDQQHIFYSLDKTPIVGLHKDPHTIFVRPLEEGDPQLSAAIRQIISHEQGVVTYSFRGKQRTIHYIHSPVTGWWYGFGIVQN